MNRFWEKVDKRGSDECWNWLASDSGDGYARFWYAGKLRPAYRVAYELAGGIILPGMQICHTCDNGMCVNPAHLFQGTAVENMQDAVAKGRRTDTKLSPSDVLAIRGEYIEGVVSMSELARTYGVSSVAIWRVVHGRSYSWITEE